MKKKKKKKGIEGLSPLLNIQLFRNDILDAAKKRGITGFVVAFEGHDVTSFIASNSKFTELFGLTALLCREVEDWHKNHKASEEA